jgi:hypothetical protein
MPDINKIKATIYRATRKASMIESKSSPSPFLARRAPEHA